MKVVLFALLVLPILFPGYPCHVYSQTGQTAADTGSVMELPEGCRALMNQVYKSVGEWNGCLDLYLPKPDSAPVPVVLLFHGGGWNHGKKEDVQRSALPYLKFGWAVANIEYRLIPAAPITAPVEDARCALLWLVANAGKYSLDPDRIVTTGTSAGGHLALMAGLLEANNPFDKDCAGGKKYRVAAIINKYGVTDVAWYLKKTHRLDNTPDKVAVANSLSPLNHIRNDVPPVITIHGDEDPTVPYDQAVQLKHLLDSAKVKNVLYTVPGGQHGKFSKEENRKISEAVQQFLIDVSLLPGKQEDRHAR